MNVGWRHSPDSRDDWSDPAFPAGRALLDPARVATAIADVRPPAAEVGTAGTARLLNVYYYPGRTLQAVHRLADGSVVTVEGVPAGSPPAPGERTVPALGAVVRPFPVDAGLPSLRDVLRTTGPDADLLTYLPGRRCVLGTRTSVAKVSTGPVVSRAHARQLALWRAPDRRFRMAEPLLLETDRAVRWERRLSGDRLDARLDGLSGDALAALVAAELAALHELSPDGLDLPLAGPEELLSRLERKTLRTLGRALPALAPQAGAAVARLRAAGIPDCGPRTPVHGDCHLANLLLDDSGVLMLDLDEMGLGDAESDLAQVATRTLLVALHSGTGLDGAVELAVALPEAYEVAGGRPVDPSAYAWYVAACLLARQVKTCVRHAAPDLPALVRQLVGLAERVLQRGVVDADLLDGARAA